MIVNSGVITEDELRQYFLAIKPSKRQEVLAGGLGHRQPAEASYYLRDIQSQHEIGLLLQTFGYPFSQVGKYYESNYLFRSGQH